MLISKEMFEIARLADKEPAGPHAIDCVKFETDGIHNEAAATDGCCAILVKWPALEETEGAEVYLIPASDCLQIKPGIKRVLKESTEKISDSDDGFTLFEEFNEIGSVFRSPKTDNRFPDVKNLIQDQIDAELDGQSYPFSVSRLARLFTTIEKLIGSGESVQLRLLVQDNESANLLVQHRGTKIIDTILLGMNS